MQATNVLIALQNIFFLYFTEQDEKMANLTATVENDVKNLQIEDEQLQAQLTGA